ncbi:MAG: hypothetical protein ACKVJN_06505 [Woeseiales bacterium]|jgi:hypothetical protein
MFACGAYGEVNNVVQQGAGFLKLVELVALDLRREIDWPCNSYLDGGNAGDRMLSLTAGSLVLLPPVKAGLKRVSKSTHKNLSANIFTHR